METITIIENDRLVANLLEELLNRVPEFKVDHIFSNGQSFLENLDSYEPTDILITDLKMPNVSIVDVIKGLKQRSTDIQIIVLSAFYNENQLNFLIRLGVSAFLPKDIDQYELIRIIQIVYEAGLYLDEHQIKVLRDQITSKTKSIPNDSKDSLTQREIDVLRLICQQLTSKEIGEKLFISTKTVEGHKMKLLAKTESKNIAQLIIYAVKNGIIDPNDLS